MPERKNNKYKNRILSLFKLIDNQYNTLMEKMFVEFDIQGEVT